jgi:glycerol-3-phosphate dehydrogenase
VRLYLTKGIHLIVDRRQLPVDDALVMAEGSRVLFAIPWGERTILGATDTAYDGPLDDVRADATDTGCVLRIANQHFPSAKLTSDDIISTWAGLRPLIADPKGKPSDISRSHQIKNPEPHWWAVADGKLTTCRLMAEQTVDHAVAEAMLRAESCTTSEEPLLVQPDPYSSILPPAFSQAAVEHFCRHEWAVHLEDVMIRRTSWHYYHRNAGDMAQLVAEWMAHCLTWDQARKSAGLAAYSHYGST